MSSSVLETCFRLLPFAGQFFAPTVAWKGIACTLRGEEDEVKKRDEHLMCLCPCNETGGVGRMRLQPDRAVFQVSALLPSFQSNCVCQLLH